MKSITLRANTVRELLDKGSATTFKVVKFRRPSYADLETMAKWSIRDVSCDGVVFHDAISRMVPIALPFGCTGERRWVKEAWAPTMFYSPCPVLYRADTPEEKTVPGQYGRRWRLSVHMPQWASRLTVENVGWKVVRADDDGADSWGVKYENGFWLFRNYFTRVDA